jgi:surfactin synthase thioesterase subunit
VLFFFHRPVRPPWCEARRPPTFDLPDPEFIEEVLALGGTPQELLADKSLMELFLPFLRADFRQLRTYAHEMKVKLRCPILVYGGLDDPEVSREDLCQWQDVCETSFVRDVSGRTFLSAQRNGKPLCGFFRAILRCEWPKWGTGEGAGRHC